MPRAADLTSVALPAIAFTPLPSPKLSAFLVLEKLLADLSYATLAFRGYGWFESHLYPLSAQHFRPGPSHPNRRSGKVSKVWFMNITELGCTFTAISGHAPLEY